MPRIGRPQGAGVESNCCTAAPDFTGGMLRIIHRLVTVNWYVYWVGSKISVPANRIV
jgi:hypothetical protein